MNISMRFPSSQSAWHAPWTNLSNQRKYVCMNVCQDMLVESNFKLKSTQDSVFLNQIDVTH